MDAAKVLKETASKFPEKPALIFQDRSISFDELKNKAFALANSLHGLGIEKGQKVGLYLPNCPEYILGYLAVFCLGAVAVPLDFMLQNDELISCLNHADVKLLIAKDKPNQKINDLKNDIPSLKKIIFLDEIESLLKDTNLPQVDIDEEDTSLIFYTSGTTGKPKGVVWNYRHLDAAPQAMEHFVDLTSKDVKISTLPLSHSGGFVYIQNCITYGITLIIMERFIPLEFLRNIERYKVSCFHIVPSMYVALLHQKELKNIDLSSLRWIVVFGAASSPEVLKRFLQFCPNAHLFNGWGLTETCPPNTVIPFGSDKIASVGKPAPWIKIKIFDEDGKEVRSGEVGEIAMKSWVVMKEYYKDPQATKEVIRDDWFYTGDLGKVDNEGFLYIVGRKKEMIKVAGQIVYAPEIEAALHKFPKIKEVAVIATSDNLRGEVPKAFVVLKEDEKSTEEEIRTFCRKHLAHFKVPHYIEFQSHLPKTGSGKIDKESLKILVDK